MDRTQLEKRLAEYEAEQRKAEAVILRLQGAQQAIKNLLADMDKEEAAKEPQVKAVK